MTSQGPLLPDSPSESTPEPLRTGYCYDAAMTLHTQQGIDPGDPNDQHHPEKPQRITCIRAILASRGLLQRMKQIPIRLVRRNEVMLVHTRDLVDKVEGLEGMTDEHITATAHFYEQLSLYVTQATSQAAALSCGGVIECALAVARGEVRNSFAIVRPPGHHAEPDEHMGFCFYNNVAVATRVIMNETPIRRVLILDWDVHHGNGTQLAFEDDDKVLYISIHRYDGGEFYPGGTYGSMNSVGIGPGKGKSVNIPWPEGHMGDADYMYAFLNIVMPIAYEFAPEFVFISAGFDAAAGDTLGMCDVTPACYAHMTALLSTLAGGKLVVALEGGYNLESIASSALAVARALLGEPLPELPRLEASEIATEVVWQVARVQSQYWHCIQSASLEPKDTADDTTIHLPELFKSWRREHALRDLGMYEFPWSVPELEDYYKGQLLVTGNISMQHTLIMFVHDFGNISTELLTLSQLNIELENAWIVDTSTEFLQWCKSQEFSVELPTAKERRETAKEAVIAAWDNLVELSDAEEVIIVAHGTAGLSVMGLIEERFQDVRAKVKGVVQVCGTHTIPVVPKYEDELRKWYHKRSMVILPRDHPIYSSDTQITRRHGRVQQSSEERVTKVMRTSLPIIQEFVAERVKPRSELQEGKRRR
ncbi:Histone deacetylase 6/10 [Ceratobasidium theobromae]|uniref:histone deacetylase n=1 Tax=Ceratobasidium theobromae TaxID=1582974 RepID=A0A5N5QEZ1_9AGAM|nr:Histone deacetylase 6/10 [Ceratobasidium theobromae]